MPFTQCVSDSLFSTSDCLELKFDVIPHLINILYSKILLKFVVSIFNREQCIKLSCCLCKQVIDETLRLGGIAIWLMREATEEIQYQGIQFHLLIIS